MDYFAMKKRAGGTEPLWWSLDGVSDTNCLAAYTFANRYSEADAKKDLTRKYGDIINNGCTWSQSNGYYVDSSKHLDQSTLRSAGIKSIVIKVTNVWAGNFMALTGNWGSPNIGVWLKTIFETALFWTHTQDTGVSHNNGNDEQALGAAALRLSTGELGAGIYGFTNTGAGILYHNGSAVSLRNATATQGANQGPWTRFRAAGLPRLVGGYGDMTDSSGNPVVMNGHFYVRALAAYNKELSAAEQLLIYQNLQLI